MKNKLSRASKAKTKYAKGVAKRAFFSGQRQEENIMGLKI